MRVTGIEYVCFSCFCLRIIRCDRSTWYHFSYCFFLEVLQHTKYKASPHADVTKVAQRVLSGLSY